MIQLYNILYVDDEPDLLEIGKLFLERSGLFSVDTITSASEALMLIPEKRYDAIISDYQMSGMDGIGFLKTVRASGNEIPFIIFTGRGREEVVIQALNEGADFYLQKGGEPVSQFAELANSVQKAILQRVAEKALRSSEENFRTLVENAPDAIYTQTHNRFVYLNTAAVHLFGASSAEELLGTNTFDRIYPSFHELIGKRLRVLTLELKPVELIDEIFVKMDGSPLDVEVTSAPFQYDGGNGALTFFRDITKRKQAESELRAAYEQIYATEGELRRHYREMAENEQQLRQSEARYRNIVEDQTEIISRFLPDGTHVFVNEAYCRYFGKSREEIIGNIFIPDIPVEDREKLKLHLTSLTQSHPVESIEHRIIMPDGEVRWQRWNDRAIFDENGNVSEFQSVGRDITDQRQAEDALRQANRRLNMMTNITRHDINSRITTLTGFLHILEKKLPDPAFDEYFQKISSTANQISAMIRFTKEYEKIGIQAPVWHGTRTIVETVAREVPLGNLIVKNDLPTGTEVLADPLIVKVFYNLMDNAVRFGGKITNIRFMEQESEDNYLIVCEDDGEGIPAEEKEKIFDRGFGRNTGFGLCFVREILSISGITIRETGEPGKGARFEMRVPKGAYRLPQET